LRSFENEDRARTHLLGKLHSLLVSLVLLRLRLPSRTPVDGRVDLVSNELGSRDVLVEIGMGSEVDLVAAKETIKKRSERG